MKSLAILLLLFNSYADGQRLRGRTTHAATTIFDQFNKEDSLEGLYINEDLLNVVTDTLPLYTEKDDFNWRDLQLARYFYDSLHVLRKVSFRNGQEGNYFFYFEGGYLRKARVRKQKQLEYLKYYFTVQDNGYTISELQQRSSQNPETKDSYEILKMGKNFLEKFKTLL